MNSKIESYILCDGNSVGGKAEQLILMNEEGYNVPSFKVLPAEYLENIIGESKEPKKVISEFKFPESDKNRILNLLPNCDFFSVRSSAIGEDGKNFSFAGQYETYLYVDPTQIFNQIKLVWLSAYSERALAYRKMNGITAPVGMAVVVQQMVDAEVSGVMFGVNPVNHKENEMLISSVYGLGEGLVSGTLNADNFYIKDENLSQSEIVEKTEKLTYNPKKNCLVLEDVVPSEINKPSLDKNQVNELITQLVSLNTFYEYPQDVEWAIANGQLYILQSRPVTHLQKSKEGVKIVWDNSNIIESYPGVTTPLTFSFIRDMYTVVYIQFCQILGLRTSVLLDNEDVFSNMLGLLRGRVYYNLRSWYHVLSLLPGYSINAGFMEDMMGVKDKFELENPYRQSKWSARWQMLVTIFKMLITFWKLPKERETFLAFVDETIAEYKAIDFDSKNPEELMRYYNDFEEVLTKQWKPPLVNDFFAMIYFGIFKKITAKYLGEENAHIHNDLLTHSNDIISIQPMRQSLQLAKSIFENEIQCAFFKTEDAKSIWNELLNGKYPNLYNEIKTYLNKFGERCLGELKLETISYNQAPYRFIEILKSYIMNPDSFKALDAHNAHDSINKANDLIETKLGKSFFKKRVFNYFLAKTRELVSNRENLRFERTRGFGIVRDIFSAMGVAFANKGLIDNDRDIFYLTKEEIFDFIKGTSVLSDLKTTIALRRLQYKKYEEDEYVPERVTTYGVVYDELFFEEERVMKEGDLEGVGCSPGVVESEVVVVNSPDQINDIGGRIMVASSTDPGWISLFPSSLAILVERGSLLSHSAIVARELGIPCIVAINGLLKRLKTGDVVRMDGSSGQIKIIANA